jgi:hypothetical protein
MKQIEPIGGEGAFSLGKLKTLKPKRPMILELGGTRMGIGDIDLDLDLGGTRMGMEDIDLDLDLEGTRRGMRDMDLGG